MNKLYSTPDFEANYTYTGNDLGAVWSAEKTAFRLWAPTAASVKVNLYKSGTVGAEDLLEQLEMIPDEKGTWVAEKQGDLNGIYYTYLVTVNGEAVEACDPYARTTGVNGRRAMVIDLDSTNPENWEMDTDPHANINITDAVIYELHVRDLSMDEHSGITHKGKFLGLTETNTVNSKGVPTGLDHIKNLGMTHIHLLPVYDFGFTDESLPLPQYNWGYDPVNFNVPEGSYSTDPFNGYVRVAEMKKMVKNLHDNGLSVIMDVVYNHVYHDQPFCFNQIVPGYFSRISHDGVWSNGSFCGNDTASERSMVRKYIVDSVNYWADEYHIDGFRFDLVGLLDVDTINDLVAAVHERHPNVVFYGEGWSMPTGITKDCKLATQLNSSLTPGFAYFNDTIRDSLRGSTFFSDALGFVTGASDMVEKLEGCFRGLPAWCQDPTQTINYISCHDNNTLLDRISLAVPEHSFEDRIRMNRLGAVFYMMSQGIPFMQAGEEMLRSKPDPKGGYVENSFKSSDRINSIKWNLLDVKPYRDTYEYYRGLIAFRKAHPVLRMTSAYEILSHVVPVQCENSLMTAFHISGDVPGETARELFLVFNASDTAESIALPEGSWHLCINAEKAGTEALAVASGAIEIPAICAMVFVKE